MKKKIKMRAKNVEWDKKKKWKREEQGVDIFYFVILFILMSLIFFIFIILFEFFILFLVCVFHVK